MGEQLLELAVLEDRDEEALTDLDLEIRDEVRLAWIRDLKDVDRRWRCWELHAEELVVKGLTGGESQRDLLLIMSDLIVSEC